MSEDNGTGAEPRIRPAETLVGRKTVTSPATGWSYVIRRLSAPTFYGIIGGLADLGDLLHDSAALVRRIAESEREQARVAAMMEKSIRAGLVEPALAPDADVWSLGITEAGWLHGQIMEFTGWTPRAAEEIRPFGTATSSSGSTTSPASTEAAPTSTSIQPAS